MERSPLVDPLGETRSLGVCFLFLIFGLILGFSFEVSLEFRWEVGVCLKSRNNFVLVQNKRICKVVGDLI